MLPNVEEATIVDWDVYWIDNMVHPWRVSDDPRLRNTREVTGYHIQATDGPLGHIMDFVVTDEAWAVRFSLVDTGNWWPGMHVLIAPLQVEAILGEERGAIGDFPETVGQIARYDDSVPLEEPPAVVQHPHRSAVSTRPAHCIDREGHVVGRFPQSSRGSRR